MAGVVEDMVRQSQCLDKINYKVLLIWDSECNCDVGWVTVLKTCGGRELKEKWRDSKYEVREWNLDTELDIVSNSVDMRDVRDVIDMNIEKEEIVIGDKDKNKNVNKGNIVRDENSISANMELKVKIGHKSQESSAGGESLGGSGRPRREGWSFSPPSYHSRISQSGIYSATTPQPLYPYHTQLTAPQPSKVGLGFVSHSYHLN